MAMLISIIAAFASIKVIAIINPYAKHNGPRIFMDKKSLKVVKDCKQKKRKTKQAETAAQLPTKAPIVMRLIHRAYSNPKNLSGDVTIRAPPLEANNGSGMYKKLTRMLKSKSHI